MPKTYGTTSERIGRASASSLSASEINSVVRRIGYVVGTAHEVIMKRLIDDGDAAFAEMVNDALKPVVDFLMHFDVEASNGNAS